MNVALEKELNKEYIAAAECYEEEINNKSLQQY